MRVSLFTLRNTPAQHETLISSQTTIRSTRPSIALALFVKHHHTRNFAMSSPSAAMEIGGTSTTDDTKLYMTKYDIQSGQGNPSTSEEESRVVTVSENTLRKHVQAKADYVGQFIIKLAALEYKSKLMEDCLAGNREAPEEWRTTRPLPNLPVGIQYSFSTTLDIDSLQTKFDQTWMEKIKDDITTNLIPRQENKVKSLHEEARLELVSELGEGAVADQAQAILKEEIAAKMEARKQRFADGQRSTLSVEKKRKFHFSSDQQRKPFKPPRNVDSRHRRQNQSQTRHGNRNFRKTNWTPKKDAN